MPEDREAMFVRVAASLRSPDVESYETWPFIGPVTPRALARPAAVEKPRSGEGGVNCRACLAASNGSVSGPASGPANRSAGNDGSDADRSYIWRSARWQLKTLGEPTGLPLILLLEPCAHFEEPGDLPDELAAELGILSARIDRAMRAVEGVARVHVGRWGEGGAHLHWWFIARPAGFEQLASSMAGIWDDVLPPVPEPVWRENIALFLAAFGPPAG